MDNHPIEQRRKEWLVNSEEIENRDPRTLEFKCRAACRWLGRSEDEWEGFKGLIFAIDAGRLEAISTYVMTPEEAKRWQNFLMTR